MSGTHFFAFVISPNKLAVTNYEIYDMFRFW